MIVDHDIPAPLLEALVWHYLLRRIGFSPDDIFVGFAEQAALAPDKPFNPAVLVVLKRPDGEFKIVVPDPLLQSLDATDGETQDRFVVAWHRAVATWKALSSVQANAIFDAHPARLHAVNLMLSLQSKGLALPEKSP